MAYVPSTCPVCLENICRTVILPCGHGICEADLERLGLGLIGSEGPFFAEEQIRVDGAEHGMRSLFDLLVVSVAFLWNLCVVAQGWIREFLTFLPSLREHYQQPATYRLHDNGASTCASNANSTHWFYVRPDRSLAEVCSFSDMQNHWRIINYSPDALQLHGSIQLLCHRDGKDLFWVGSDSKLHELRHRQDSNWRWQHTKHDVPAMLPDSKLVAVRNDNSMKVFWSGSDGQFHELHKGYYNGWRWEVKVHDTPGLHPSHAASTAIVCHNDVFNLFWVGSDSKLHELHQGQHNNWRWQHTTHDVPAMLPDSKLAAGRNDKSMKVFWSGSDGQFHELHMGHYNDWQWQHEVHDAPGLQSGLNRSTAIACHDDVFNLFWVGSDSKLHELHQGPHSNWRWQHTRHDVPAMSTNTKLVSSRNSHQFGIFWIGTDSMIHIMHQGTGVGWRWKHVSLEG
eukprot:CAMPEP_0197628472 /NCGR_PEP_ID=MMETSP1338-20131121/6771_1 /TAXON_ID=43686 ORGANISM="Pelagodinium beii, Strain RCC1491" /NCGR_SAMPLE_ID=MMETSP1338 /ASSEMBLY_ACC=CAM_ASM_000754 /LENGTH=452 /DNA_ID=CAMNT_0043199453 /DNA_START=116 /DNA_END=1474 /DNA_ORIENTATION=+